MEVLIVDDHGLVREGLRAILTRSVLAAHCLEAWDAESLRVRLLEHPDIRLVLLDIQLPDCNGFDLLTELVSRQPDLAVIMLSAEYDGDMVKRAIESGAAGFLPKSTLNQVLVSAIQLVIEGGVYIPPEVLRKASASASAHRYSSAAQAEISFESLGFTARQIDVFRLLGTGMSNKQICRELDLAEATVKIHVRGILRALDVSSRSEAIVKANKLGLCFSADTVASDTQAGNTPAAARAGDMPL